LIFSSPIFLFLFLPLVVVGSLLVGRRLQNAFLLFASLVFYAWGEVTWAWVIVLSIGLNYGLGLWLGATDRKKAVVALAISVNLGLLAAFKYANFIVENLNGVTRLFGVTPLRLGHVHLPIGISFFTFHALSYLIDVYRGQVRPQRKPVDFALYITMFPQLIAGPIIRYHDIAAQLGTHRINGPEFAGGIRRFVLGLGKKVLIANTVAVQADLIFAIPHKDLTAPVAWLGIVLYTLQIYFDFSAYSDMALGLGHMFGLRFLENFNYPYIAESITEFWRRWHISLSNWYRDYLYIPLGGNRGGRLRTYFNLVMVFFLCGLWHGASWSFVAWGLFHGAFLVMERMGLGALVGKLPRPLRHAYLLAVVMVGWVFFRADTLHYAVQYLGAMVGLGHGSGVEFHAGLYLRPDVMLAVVAGAIGSGPVVPWLASCRADLRTSSSPGAAPCYLAWEIGAVATTALVFVASAALLVGGTYNPFIYFRF
jgi:alginate O-acetyltransferase complex protein AlgI